MLFFNAVETVLHPFLICVLIIVTGTGKYKKDSFRFKGEIKV